MHAIIRSGRLAATLLSGFAALAVCAAPALAASAVAGTEAPLCPGPGTAPHPPFGKLDGAPSFASWRDLDALPAGCRVRLDGPPGLVVALAGRFTHRGSIDDLAARAGAISATRGLRYWSVTGGAWRELISDAVALDSPAPATRRPDFSSAEVRSGRTLHFAQNDTRSWGLNVFAVRALDASPDRLVLGSENVTPIRLGPITLFGERDLRTVQFVDRVDRDTWSYFGLTVVRDGAPEGSEGSLANRQDALYRFLAGQAPEGRPPLVP